MNTQHHRLQQTLCSSRTPGASGGGGGSSDSIIKDTMADLLERLPDNFEMITMQLRAKPLLEGESGPFVVVALQVRFWDSRKRRRIAFRKLEKTPPVCMVAAALPLWC